LCQNRYKLNTYSDFLVGLQKYIIINKEEIRVKKIIKILALMFSTILMFTLINSDVQAYAKSVVPEKAYNIKGLKHNLNVQNFYIGSNYLYVTQRHESTTYLSRCIISGNTATYKDEMVLSNCGHGQTLEYMQYDNKSYFLVGCKSSSTDEMNWSLQIGVIEYTPGKKLDYTDMKRFSFMNYANKNATSIGTTKRVAAATSQDNNRIIFRICNTDNDFTYSIYDRNALLKMLLKETNDTNLDMRKAKSACITSFTQKGKARVWPNKSFQGLEMTGTSNVYISGGAEGDTAQICKMDTKGTLKSTVSITGVNKTKESLLPEIEGLQAKKVNGENRLYFLLPYYGKNILIKTKTNTQQIYYIKESDF